MVVGGKLADGRRSQDPALHTDLDRTLWRLDESIRKQFSLPAPSRIDLSVLSNDGKRLATASGV